jgi:hypothetical protein
MAVPPNSSPTSKWDGRDLHFLWEAENEWEDCSLTHISINKSWAWWHVPVIIATQEA